jgi:hypothetical protein
MDLSTNGIIAFLKETGYFAAGVQLLKDALAEYQKYHRLPVTGQSDDATLAHMCQRRCRLPDNPYGPQQQTMKWGKNNLTWKFVNYTLDIPQNQISDSFEKGFGVWSACTPLTFREVMANDEADITITFKGIDGQSNVLAQTWFPPEGVMQFDEAEAWSWRLPIGRGQVDLATVVAHEAGHLIGLQHSQVQGAQMAPVYAGPKRFLEADDIRRAQQLYGSR